MYLVVVGIYMELQMMVLGEVTGEGVKIEERKPSSKPWNLPVLRDWEGGEGSLQRRR